MRDLNRNPRERSVNAFCFGKKQNLSEGGLKTLRLGLRNRHHMEEVWGKQMKLPI